jgi:phage tail-like protein
MLTPTIRSPSRLLDDLPTIYQDDPFMGQFLLAFEKILLGIGDTTLYPKAKDSVKFPAQGLEESIAGLSTYFDLKEAPAEFLPWLASWTAFSLRADLDEVLQRKFIANITKYYRLRGTKANLQELLSLFVRGEPTIEETSTSELQIGVHSTIGKDMFLSGGSPHFFKVTIVLPESLKGDRLALARQLEIASSIIELEKPAHTHYELIPIFPGTIRIGEVSKVGVDTLLGTIPVNSGSIPPSPP